MLLMDALIESVPQQLITLNEDQPMPPPYWLLLGLLAGTDGPNLDPKFATFPTLDACQSAATAAKELLRAPELLTCLHVDQVSQFSTVQGTWRNK
jgi:hypothetical protein